VHPSAPEDFKLVIPKLEVKPGQVCAIVGRVGGGELLNLILKEHELTVLGCGLVKYGSHPHEFHSLNPKLACGSHARCSTVP